jgi:uncharacterized protein
VTSADRSSRPGHTRRVRHGGSLSNGLIGFAVGITGGLIGLGGAELRLPYLVGVLRLTPHQAVPANLAVSLFTVLAAIPTRLISLPQVSLGPYLAETLCIAAGAVVAAYLGVGWLRRLSGPALGRLIFGLLVVLGLGLMLEAWFELASDGLLPASPWVRLLAGFGFGLLIGAISSVLGVAGGEVIIPTLVFAYGVPIKAAGSLSMVISLPTVLTGMMRHARAGAYSSRGLLTRLVLPMGVGSSLRAVVGGLSVGLVSASVLKVVLGALLIWSAWKVFTKHG